MSETSPNLARRLVAELLGTFILVFMGTFAVVAISGSLLGQRELTVGLAFSAGAVGAIFAFGHVSGAHLNPAVSISLAARGKFPWKEVVPYAVAQIVGSVLAALVNYSIIGFSRSQTTRLGATYPGGAYGAPAALTMEIITTFILVLVILSVTEKEAPAGFAGIAIGLVLGLNVTIALNVSGGSMNPARSLGPALALVLIGVPPATAFDFHWIYWAGPILGGILAAMIHWAKS